MKPFLTIILAAIGLFLINNIVLAVPLSHLPGGTALGATTTLVLTILILHYRMPGTTMLTYGVYGSVSFLFHLFEAWHYLGILALLLAAAAVCDLVVIISKHRILGILLGYTAMAGIVVFVHRQELLPVLAMGYLGIACGTFFQRIVLPRLSR